MSQEATTSGSANIEEAFGVLVEAVRGLQAESGRAPTASEARLGMKRLTYNGFKPKDFGFTRFRHFLTEAEKRGLVELRAGKGDLSVLVAGEEPSHAGARRVRGDLWKAFIDWSPSRSHFFDLTAGRAVTIPKNPVPLEPERFRLVRERVTAQDPNLIPIPNVDVATQLSWMEHFAAACDDAGLRELLLTALKGDKPAKVFTSVLRGNPAAFEDWHSQLHTQILTKVRAWKTDHQKLADLEIEAEQREPQSTAGSRTDGGKDGSSVEVREWFDTVTKLAATSTQHAGLHVSHSRPTRALFYGGNSQAAPSDLRTALHRAIERMPEAELRQIRLPVGFLFEE